MSSNYSLGIVTTVFTEVVETPSPSTLDWSVAVWEMSVFSWLPNLETVETYPSHIES